MTESVDSFREGVQFTAGLSSKLPLLHSFSETSSRIFLLVFLTDLFGVLFGEISFASWSLTHGLETRFDFFGGEQCGCELCLVFRTDRLPCAYNNIFYYLELQI